MYVRTSHERKESVGTKKSELMILEYSNAVKKDVKENIGMNDEEK